MATSAPFVTRYGALTQTMPTIEMLEYRKQKHTKNCGLKAAPLILCKVGAARAGLAESEEHEILSTRRV